MAWSRGLEDHGDGSLCGTGAVVAGVGRRGAALRSENDRRLVALCSSRPEDPLYAEARQFCYGYMAGVAQLHRALVRTGEIEPLACPKHEVSREALAQVFLDWARDNAGAADGLPAESVRRAAASMWPCS